MNLKSIRGNLKGLPETVRVPIRMREGLLDGRFMPHSDKRVRRTGQAC